MKFSNFDDQHLKNLNVFHINIILGFQRSAKKKCTFETISCSVITLCAKLKTFLSNDKLLKNGNV